MHRVPSRAPKAGNETAAGWRAVCFFRGNRDPHIKHERVQSAGGCPCAVSAGAVPVARLRR
jgi:hypothetical protein